MPDQSPDEQIGLVRLYSSAHGGEDPVTLGQTHTETLKETLSYWAAGKRMDLGAATWGGIDDECPGCRVFKASMYEATTDSELRWDAAGEQLELPIAFVRIGGKPASESTQQYMDWIIHGGQRLTGDGTSESADTGSLGVREALNPPDNLLPEDHPFAETVAATSLFAATALSDQNGQPVYCLAFVATDGGTEGVS